MCQILLTVLLALILTLSAADLTNFDAIFDDFFKYTGESILAFLKQWVLLIRLVPLEVVLITGLSRMAYVHFVESDARMFSFDKFNGKYNHCKVHSMQLIDQAGEIYHMFCDKTGTLTKNEFRLKAITFNGLVCKSDTLFNVLRTVYSNNCERAEMLFKCFVICNNVTVIRNEQG